MGQGRAVGAQVPTGQGSPDEDRQEDLNGPYLPVIVVSGGPKVSSLVEHRDLHPTLTRSEEGGRFVQAVYREITAHAVVVPS